MKIYARPHRGSYADSMAERTEFTNMKHALEQLSLTFIGGVPLEDIVIKYYGLDKRLGQDVYIVVAMKEGVSYGVLGYMEFEE